MQKKTVTTKEGNRENLFHHLKQKHPDEESQKSYKGLFFFHVIEYH